MTYRGLLGLALCLVAMLGGAARAHAQAEARARALFGEGRDLARAGRHDEACPKFEESARIDRGMGTLFNLADCYENVGRTASAWALFTEVSVSAMHAGMGERERVARERARALEARLVKLTIDVPAGTRVDGLELRLDGAVIGPTAWGTAMPIDPGRHTIDAHAPSRHAWSRVLTARERERELMLRVPKLAERSELPPPEAPRETDAPSERRTATLRWVGIAGTTAGLAVLSTGGLLGLRAKSTYDDASEHCDASGCDREGLALRARAVDQGNRATATSISGAAITLGGAITWWIASRREGDEREASRVSVAVGLRSIAVRRTW